MDNERRAPIHRFAVRLPNEPTAFERVAGLLRRRGHQLVSLRAGRSDDPSMIEMTLEIMPRLGRPERVALDLRRLPAVTDVQELGAQSDEAVAMLGRNRHGVAGGQASEIGCQQESDLDVPQVGA